MKRFVLTIYAIVLWFVGIMWLPLLMVGINVTEEYSKARIWLIENFLAHQYEYRYRVLQLTTKEDGIGYSGLITIDSAISGLEEVLYETKQRTELVQCA